MENLIERFTEKMRSSDLADICTVVGVSRFKRFELFYFKQPTKIQDLKHIKPCKDKVKDFIFNLSRDEKMKVENYLLDYFPDTYRERTFHVSDKHGNWHKVCKSKEEEYKLYNSFENEADVHVIFN